MKITSNYNWREFLSSDELTKKELEDFDYLSEDELITATFLRYRGIVYELGEFCSMSDKDSYWDAAVSTSAFSGVVIRLSDDGCSYQIGRALS